MGLNSTTLVRSLPAQHWYSTDSRGRLFRNGAILAIALALHLLAALALGRTSATRGAAVTAAPTITTLWLLGTEPAPRSDVAPKPIASPARPKSKSAAVPKQAALASPAARLDTTAALTRPEPQEAAPIAAPSAASSAATSVGASDYAFARRSLAFGGAHARDEVSTAAPAKTLDAWVNEGVARSVWAVANELVAAGDGRCEISAPEARFVCESTELNNAFAQVAEPAQRSLASWVRGGFVRAIEIRFARGGAQYDLRF